MRRVIIIRKDLNLSQGKLMAMSMHLAEAYWTNLLKKMSVENNVEVNDVAHTFRFKVDIDQDIWVQYVLGIFTKTICECKNKDALHKIDDVIKVLKLVEGTDYGYINDSCKTELTPENPDGTCTVGMWFRPLPDEVAHKISKKFKLYGVFDK